MRVNHNSDMKKHHLPGLEHQTLAGGRDGLGTMEVWRQTIAAGAATPVHRHDCEEVIICMKGAAVCHYNGAEYHFKEDETLVIPAGVTHQICNAGDGDLHIIATLAMAPVRVETAERQHMALPWDGNNA
ncbi:MAG: cupin domain-containing protein [Proteobacteria bacterium]|jgi:mannose-6-phosphate isomerase-like protein (cupin superfamily)|nr:cupin domain-containing protein [Pseudomonadota bacterium]MBK8957069.1 cupin domain-containing protein [Pseudomonadota bacterium]